MKQAKQINIKNLATKADLHRLEDTVEKGFEQLAGMMSRSFDKLGDEIHEVRDDVKIVKGVVKDLQGRVGNIEIALRQDQGRLGVIEKHIGIDRL